MHTAMILRPAVGTALILLGPLAMTLLDRGKPIGTGWHWSPMDFAIMAALLFGAGFAYELVFRRLAHRRQRIVLAIAIVLLVFVVWAELAVGAVRQVLGLLGG